MQDCYESLLQGNFMRNLTKVFHAMIMVVATLFVALSPAQAGVKAWQISESNGSVTVETTSGGRDASRGMILMAGDAVVTGVASRAVLVRGGEYVILSPKSRVRITKPEETGAVTQIFQSLGSALFKIEKKETPHFGVKTPYLAAVVKGTTFNVTVTDNGATVQVTEGRVEVSTLDGGATDMIVPGRIGRIDANDRQLLKVLGTDEKSIRSPSVPSEAPAVIPEAPTSAVSNDSQASSKTDIKNDAPAVSDMEITPVASDSAYSDTVSGFSGRIGTQISSEALSVSVATDGLISSSQAMDRAPSGGAANSNSGASDVAVGETVVGNDNAPADSNSGGKDVAVGAADDAADSSLADAVSVAASGSANVVDSSSTFATIDKTIDKGGIDKGAVTGNGGSNNVTISGGANVLDNGATFVTADKSIDKGAITGNDDILGRGGNGNGNDATLGDGGKSSRKPTR